MADLSLHHISKSFGRQRVLDDISLSVADREFTVLVGPSGCGKSTLLRLIAGLEVPSTGDILIGGERANDLSPRERGIAMVFQSYALYPHMSVYDNMAFGLRQARTTKSEIDAKVRKAAGRLQIEELLERKPKALSGGQRQRVAIGRAIVREPRVFLFDEPLSNLDASLRTQMRLELMALHRELETTIVYVTHDQAEAMTLASSLVVLKDGRIEQTGKPLDIYTRPANRFVAQFIGSPRMNIIAGRFKSAGASGAQVSIAGGYRVVVPVVASSMSPGTPVLLGLRPEHIYRSTTEDGLAARISATEQLGNESFIHAHLSSGEAVTWRVRGTSEARPGEEVRLGLEALQGHLFDASGTAFARLES